MKIEYDVKMVYRVWYGPQIEKEAFFSEKEAAEAFAKLVNGQLNLYKWQVQIEK